LNSPATYARRWIASKMNSNEKRLFKQVKELQKSGNYQGAADLMQVILKIEPDEPALWTCYGGILSDLQSWKDAESAFAKAIELNPQHVTAHLGRGSMLSSRGMRVEAEACFRKALKIDPENQLARDCLLDMEKYGHLI
jgi:Flp pilus assembly protein TadD